MSLLEEALENVDTKLEEHGEEGQTQAGRVMDCAAVAREFGVEEAELAAVLRVIERHTLAAILSGHSVSQIVRGIFTQGVALGLELARLRAEA